MFVNIKNKYVMLKLLWLLNVLYFKKLFILNFYNNWFYLICIRNVLVLCWKIKKILCKNICKILFKIIFISNVKV